MKKFLVIFMILLCPVLYASDEMSLEHAQYLESALSGIDYPTDVRGVNVEELELLYNTDKAASATPAYGFKIAISERLFEKIKNTYVKHEALKKLDIYLRPDKIVIDGTIYFDLLELDIPFTVTSKVFTKENNVIALDVTEMKVWAEGNLPTDKILDKIVKFIKKNTEIGKIMDISYESVATRYESYGRIIVKTQITKFVPMMPEIYITRVTTADKEVIVYGK